MGGVKKARNVFDTFFMLVINDTEKMTWIQFVWIEMDFVAFFLNFKSVFNYQIIYGLACILAWWPRIVIFFENGETFFLCKASRCAG